MIRNGLPTETGAGVWEVTFLRNSFSSDFIARLMAQITVTSDDSECWNWQGATSTDSGRIRGAITHMGKPIRPHRVIAILAHGDPVGNKQYALHSCDNPLCCNPKHLRWGTPKDNTEDRDTRQRHASYKQTHCIRGHLRTEENRHRNGIRNGIVQWSCAECRLENHRRAKVRKEMA